MSEEKLLFKCTVANSVKDINEAINVSNKKGIIILKVLMRLWLILVFVCYIGYKMYSEDLFLSEAIVYFLSSKLLVLTYIFAIICTWKIVEIQNWIHVNIDHIKTKNIQKPASHIGFYETYYEMLIFEKSTKTYSLARINYSDVTNFFTTGNLYILCRFKPKSLSSIAWIRKDSFIEGTEQDFIKFIESKINKQS